jgi:cathepsin L
MTKNTHRILQLLMLLSLTLRTIVAYQSFEEWSISSLGSTLFPYGSASEVRRRKAIYESNLEQIVVHNNYIQSEVGHWPYRMGINQFMDLEDHEVPRGYDKSLHRSSSTTATTERHLSQDDENELSKLLPYIHDVQDLPKSVDWRFAATPVKDQGACGSCWAFASVAALESYLYLNEGLLFSLSVQEVVSCAPNVKQCGGEGGCTGATSVQAYDYLKRVGVVQEWSFGYASYHGELVECKLEPQANHKPEGGDANLVKGAVATIDGFVSLPPNNYTIMMNAVAKLGPIVISVAASGWSFYAGGVFHRNFSTAGDADINHAVVLMGYGTDEESGEDYWLIRNSWSPRWGEEGYIRLFREDPAVASSSDQCAMDVTPGDGDACRYDDNGTQVDPLPSQKVCGTSGVYYMGYIPIGVRLV